MLDFNIFLAGVNVRVNTCLRSLHKSVVVGFRLYTDTFSFVY